MNILFLPAAFDEYRQWVIDDMQVFKKLNALITEILRDPFHGTGKPEPLKHEYAGCWSRRINREHRIVYMVSDNLITVLSCKSHYGK